MKSHSALVLIFFAANLLVLRAQTTNPRIPENISFESVCLYQAEVMAATPLGSEACWQNTGGVASTLRVSLNHRLRGWASLRDGSAF